ncbi:MAG: phosphotriesterase family protein [Anaerolineae bacterium]
MTVMTVLGPIPAAQLGMVLPHEHLFIDLRNQYTEPTDPDQRALGREELALSNAGILRRNPYALRSNLLLDNLSLAADELKPFKRLGGRTVVECTPLGIGRDALGLKLLARATDLNIIAGCGYYTADVHPPELAAWSPAEIARRIVLDLTHGMDSTSIRAGVIGEIGTSWPIHSNELKVLQGAALAHKETGAAVYVHCYPWGKGGLQAAQLLLKAGVAAAKIVICHVDVEIDLVYIRQLLDLGVFVEFDNFGKEFYIDPPDRGFAGGVFARDLERIGAMLALIKAGYIRQLLITNDICLKSMLHAYGGWGYDHVPLHILPMLHEARIAEESIRLLTAGNPARLLDMPG